MVVCSTTIQYFMALCVVLCLMIVSFMVICSFTALALTSVALLVDRVLKRISPLFDSNDVKLGKALMGKGDSNDDRN